MLTEVGMRELHFLGWGHHFLREESELSGSQQHAVLTQSSHSHASPCYTLPVPCNCETNPFFPPVLPFVRVFSDRRNPKATLYLPLWTWIKPAPLGCSLVHCLCATSPLGPGEFPCWVSSVPSLSLPKLRSRAPLLWGCWAP